jgi:hypothetical protein
LNTVHYDSRLYGLFPDLLIYMTREKRTVTRGEPLFDILNPCRLMQHPKLVSFVNVRNELFTPTCRVVCLPHTPLLFGSARRQTANVY